ncbi:hypothetical protein ACHAP3_010440 [Botrytis cinerea]
MELGGKNNAIVCAGADLQKAAKECIVGAVLHSGQICMLTDRIIIHADIAERFLEILKVTIINLASSVPAPPYLVNAAAKSRLQPREGDGATPVIFAPMIIRVAAVSTQDVRKGFAIAKQLEAGAVHINSMSVRDELALPMGGMKNSGWGRFNTMLRIEEFLVAKSVTWDD